MLFKHSAGSLFYLQYFEGGVCVLAVIAEIYVHGKVQWTVFQIESARSSVFTLNIYAMSSSVGGTMTEWLVPLPQRSVMILRECVALSGVIMYSVCLSRVPHRFKICPIGYTSCLVNLTPDQT